MKNYRLFVKFFGISIISVILMRIGFHYDGSDRLSLGFIVAFILFESAYYLAEKSSQEVLRFTTGNIKHYKWNSMLLLSFSSIVIIGNIFYNGWILRPIFPMLMFLILGLRGLIFTKQTVESIRVFKQGVEHGFWQRFVCWERIINYSVQDDFIYLHTGKKRFTIKEVKLEFAVSKDVIIFENILKDKRIKSVEN